MNLCSALRCRVLAFAAIVALLGILPGAARAQIGSDRYASIVIDEQTGQIISAANPDEYRFPASLTKMMTIYLVFEAIRDHRLKLFRPGARVGLGRLDAADQARTDPRIDADRGAGHHEPGHQIGQRCRRPRSAN